tara:strand:- start:86 stop:988 length:903 start_codon:yes stop_codon:yes gene_type:complete
MGNTFSRKKKKVKFKLSPEQIKEYITDDGIIDMDKLRDEYDESGENKKKTNIETKVKKDKPKIKEEIVVIQDDDNFEISEKNENENDEKEEIEQEVDEKDVELVTEDKPKEHVRIAKPAFDTLVEALYDAGIKANRSVQISNLYHLDWYFENLPDISKNNDENVEEILEEQNKILSENVLQPRMVKIRIPDPDPNNKTHWKIIEIPLFTLVKHNSLKIDTMDVELKFNMGKIVKKTELKKNKFHSIKATEGKPLIKKKWKIRIATPVRDNSNFATLKIKFSYDSPLESITRLTERYDRFL